MSDIPGLLDSIKLDKESKVPMYMQLYNKIKEMIMQGILLPDFQLPSVRQFRDLLQINQVTVVSALKMLENEGYVYKKPGSGTFVSRSIPTVSYNVTGDANPISDELYQQDDTFLISNGQIKIGANTVNFASATPTPDLFPVEDFRKVLDEVLERDRGNAFGYQDSQGFYPIRESILGTLHKSNIAATPESIQIISGAQQGIDIISKALLTQGDYVVTESPTYTGALAVFKSRGAHIVDIEMLEDGPDLDIFEYNIKKYRPKLVYSIPSFQNPTGYSYSNSKRREIIDLSIKYDFYILEDDYVSDLDFENRNYLPLKAIDKHDRVIFIKSFSKIFMPGLRLGFIIVPSKLTNIILQAKHTTDISTSGLIQRSFDLYIRKGYWDKHFEFMFNIYKERYLKVIQALDNYLPAGVRFSRPGGGLNIWLSLPYGFPIETLIRQAASEDIVFAPGRIFYSSPHVQKLNNIRLSFASVYIEQIEDGIRKLCGMISRLGNRKTEDRRLPLL